MNFSSRQQRLKFFIIIHIILLGFFFTLKRQSNELLESKTAGEIAIQLSECVEQAQSEKQSINDDAQQAYIQSEGEGEILEENLPELEDGVIIDGIWHQ